MNKESKIFFITFFSLILFAIAISFYKYFILEDYYIRAEVECNPGQEKCFMTQCDPATDSECPEDADARISYYKLLKKKARDIPLCDAASPECQPFVCQQGEDCQEIFCDETTKIEGVECSNSTMPQ